LPITDRNTEKKFIIESVSTPQEVTVETLQYDIDKKYTSLFDVSNNSVQYKWFYTNYFSKLSQQQDNKIFYNNEYIDSFYVCDISSSLYKDRIKPGSFQLHIGDNPQNKCLRFIDWNADDLGPVFSITGCDSLTTSLSSSMSGEVVSGFTVDILFRPFYSNSEKCLFHRWTTKNGAVYDKFYGYSESTYYGDYNNWGIGSFIGHDKYGDYIDFFVYGDNKLTLTGTCSAIENFSQSLTSTSASGNYYVASSNVDGKYIFYIQVDYDIKHALWPVVYSCTANSDISGIISGRIDWEIPAALTGTFTGNFELAFHDMQNQNIANVLDTRYYLPKSCDIYDGDFHRLQFLWSVDELQSGVVFLDGEELTNKLQFGSGRYTNIDFSLTSSISATPFSIFGFIESEKIGDINEYCKSSNSFFGELYSFVLYDKAIYNSTLRQDSYKALNLLAGQLELDGRRIFFDPIYGYNITNFSASAIDQLQHFYTAYLTDYKYNVVLYFNADDYESDDILIDRSVLYGKQYLPSTGHVGKIYKNNNEGSFCYVTNMLFDLKDISANFIPSSDDITITSMASQITTEYKFANLYKREGLSISNFGINSNLYNYEAIGIINYDNGICTIFDDSVDSSNYYVILSSIEKTYKNIIDIEIEGEFFTRSENQSGWYQNSVNDFRPKSPTKYINGVVVYDNEGDEIMIVKFPSIVKKTVYDDINIRLII
jgi:hypothetical protein